MTTFPLTKLLEDLKDKGWHVRSSLSPVQLPDDVAQRYPVLPQDYREFLRQVEACISPDETVWFLCVSDFRGTSESAFAWNEWERISLDAAEEDDVLQA